MSLSVVRQFSIYMSSKGRKGSYINGLLKVAKAFIQYCYDEGYTEHTVPWMESASFSGAKPLKY